MITYQEHPQGTLLFDFHIIIHDNQPVNQDSAETSTDLTSSHLTSLYRLFHLWDFPETSRTSLHLTNPCCDSPDRLCTTTLTSSPDLPSSQLPSLCTTPPKTQSRIFQSLSRFDLPHVHVPTSTLTEHALTEKVHNSVETADLHCNAQLSLRPLHTEPQDLPRTFPDPDRLMRMHLRGTLVNI